MMPEQAELLVQARHSLSAGHLLQAEGYAGFAASGAYYACFTLLKPFCLAKVSHFQNIVVCMRLLRQISPKQV